MGLLLGNRDGICENAGMTGSSSLCCAVTLVYCDACLKKFRGRSSPRASTTRKTGGRHLNSEGFITSLHANMLSTPISILATATSQPILLMLNGTVPGTGSDRA